MNDTEKEPARTYSHWLEARAAADGHPEPEFLTTLAEILAGKANAGELEGFEVWPGA